LSKKCSKKEEKGTPESEEANNTLKVLIRTPVTSSVTLEIEEARNRLAAPPSTSSGTDEVRNPPAAPIRTPVAPGIEEARNHPTIPIRTPVTSSVTGC
jgi:hypothetical protein